MIERFTVKLLKIQELFMMEKAFSFFLGSRFFFGKAQKRLFSVLNGKVPEVLFLLELICPEFYSKPDHPKNAAKEIAYHGDSELA